MFNKRFCHGFHWNTKTPVRYTGGAHALLKEGKLDSVIAGYRKYCEDHPNDARGHLILAMLLSHHMDKLDEVLDELHKVVKLKPKDAETYAWFPHSVAADLLKIHGKVDEAVVAYRIAMDFAPPGGVGAETKIITTYAQAETWDAAAEFGRQMIERDRDSAWKWQVQAPILILGGDATAYREHCRRMVERFGETEDYEQASKTCKVCCLMPDAIGLTQLPLEKLAPSLDQETTADWFLPWGWNTRALVSYRRGDAKTVLPYLQRSEKTNPSEHAHALNLVVRAMAQMKLGHVDEARIDLEEASKAIDGLSNSKAYLYQDVLIPRIVLQEAKTNIEDDTVPKDE